MLLLISYSLLKQPIHSLTNISIILLTSKEVLVNCGDFLFFIATTCQQRIIFMGSRAQYKYDLEEIEIQIQSGNGNTNENMYFPKTKHWM